ncbi:MAG TPA: PhzF family phenazine biosynthesis protein [Planctomycetota bacterium]|nr:PhzF family phenazine biosynthesis protein [Planctomycetota bacterium]
MKSFPVYHVDAFTSRPFGGNPAGVVLDAEGLTTGQMQLVARELQHSETAFVTPSPEADYRIRFFTPVREVDLCGHATIATAWVLASEGRLKRGRARQETNLGILDLDIDRELVMMEQRPPAIEAVALNRDDLAEVLGIEAIDRELPVQKASTGVWSLIVPMAGQKEINLCQPRFPELAALNLELGVLGTHLFTIEPGGTLYARHFAPACGVNEDPVTGTANGALGGYLVLNSIARGPEFHVRQGDALGRPGELTVHATAHEVRIGGRAVILSRGSITF